MSTAAVTTAVKPASGAANATQTSAASKRRFIAHITRDQGPEFEQSLPFQNLSAQSTATSLRTDRKIAFFLLYVTGRITNGGSTVAWRSGPPLLGGNSGAALFSLIQQFDLRGQHARYGALTPILMRG